MKKLILALALCLTLGITLTTNMVLAADPIRVLIVTGGHEFERDPFFAAFKSMEGITCEEVQHPKFHERLKAEAAQKYDVILLYDLWQDISEEAKADFVSLLKSGKGLVATHHCIASYQKWDEYTKIIGGKYHLEPYKVNGVEKPASTYKHDVNLKVHVVDSNHPITKGMKDFEIMEETYGKFTVEPGVRPLLTTTEPTCGPIIGWEHKYGNSKVAYIMLGHDGKAFQNPNYRQVIRQTIFWAAGK